MEFSTYTQQAVFENPKITAFLLDTIIENLSYIYGEDMGSEENRNSWIAYNLKQKDDTWHVIVGSRSGTPLGFIIYSIKSRILSVNDIEIIKSERHNPALLRGLLRSMLMGENNNFDSIYGYINRNNLTSQRNFLKYATNITKRQSCFSFEINQEATQRIKAKITD